MAGLQQFRRILYATTCQDDDLAALTQAVSLARNNSARLTALLVRPELPQNLAQQANGYDDFLRAQKRQLIEQVSAQLGHTEKVTDIDVLGTGQPSGIIVEHVLSRQFDLVVKEADRTESGQGFEPVDMALLKYCPAPLWLSKPISRHRE